MPRGSRLLELWRRRGASYPLRVLRDVAWPRLLAWAFFEAPFAYRLGKVLDRFRRRPSPPGHHATADREEIVLGRIDNDGRLTPGSEISAADLPTGFEVVEAERFVPRYRFSLDLVKVGEKLAIRKDYRGDRNAFERERQSLSALETCTASPSVLHAEGTGPRLYKEFVAGPTLRQRLVEAGARILSLETESEPTLAAMSPLERIEAVWERGRERIEAVGGDAFVDDLARQLEAVHRRGVTGFSLSFGNVVLDERDGAPRFIDFDAARLHPSVESWSFARGRDRDRELFNRIYGTDLLTERTARRLLARLTTPYAPFDLGRGLATRGFWSIDSGTGRWDFLNRRVLGDLVAGARILDLGSYNALLPLLMLAAGATRVVAVEKDPDNVARARDLARLFEWRHLRRFDLELRHADMRAVLEGDWGSFELITAFCSLYYLGEEEMARMVRRAAGMAPAMVLQAKTDTRETAADDKANKSSLSFLRALLRKNGFPRVEVVAPENYSRPLLIGHKNPARD